MSKIVELREKQAVVMTQARERLDQITANTDEARAKELETQHDAAMAEYDRLEGVIQREEKLEAAEKRAAEQREKRRPNSGDASVPAADSEKKPEYRDAFLAMLRSGGDVSEMEPELRAILKAGVAKFEGRAQTAGTTTAGGYTVPTTMAGFIVKSMAMWGPMYDENICTVITTAGGESIKIPTVNDTAVTMGQHSEGVALTDDGSKDVTFGQKSLDAYAYDTQFLKVSMELLQDSAFNVEQLIGELLGERIGRRVNTELTTGDGTGDPNGVVTASSLGKVAASATAITADEIIDLFHSVNPAYRSSPKARFMFHDTTLQAIRKLKDGQGNYLWQMGDVKSEVPSLLLGKPYSVNQAVDSIAANKKVIVFGDFGKYYVRKVGAPVIGVLRERFWPDLGIAGVVRLDGELGDTAAVKYLKTSNT